jgi:hypothetical protein
MLGCTAKTKVRVLILHHVMKAHGIVGAQFHAFLMFAVDRGEWSASPYTPLPSTNLKNHHRPL